MFILTLNRCFSGEISGFLFWSFAENEIVKLSNKPESVQGPSELPEQ